MGWQSIANLPSLSLGRRDLTGLCNCYESTIMGGTCQVCHDDQPYRPTSTSKHFLSGRRQDLIAFMIMNQRAVPPNSFGRPLGHSSHYICVMLLMNMDEYIERQDTDTEESNDCDHV